MPKHSDVPVLPTTICCASVRVHGSRNRIGQATHETYAMLTTLKMQPEYAWLNEVSSVPVQQLLWHLQTAFSSFFLPGVTNAHPSKRRMDAVLNMHFPCTPPNAAIVILSCSARMSLAVASF
ncbi:MAG: hypothetical protein KGI54_03730 [Pseudomonadota bacterium]|nr:hypothetical protein [Pseudomonadota bacterium]